jgi:hypothetical protein
MNFENIGCPIAKVINKNNNSEKILSVESDEEKVKNYFEEYKCLKGEHMQQIPVKTKERSVLFVSGKSGAGKSTFSRFYIEEYHKMYKKRPVYVFSYFQEDPSLDSLKYLKRIPLDDKFLQTTFALEDFAEALILFDDIDTIKSKAMKTKLFHILNSLLQLGRHTKTTILYLSHICTNGSDTRIILAESTSITIFPAVMHGRSLRYLLEMYYGFSKSQIARVKSLKSRSVTIINTYPNICLYSGGAYVLKCDD